MSKLYLVPTPIGNLDDITLRALRVLKEDVDVILCEDTRTSGNLLKHYGIDKRVVAHHLHNEHKTVEHITAQIGAGQRTALVTDAGTPAISDPGFLLVRSCIEAGIEVETLPGATAFVPALVNSGLPADRFFFEGFLPHKKGRATRIEWLAGVPHTIIFYESPFRLAKTLNQLAEKFGDNRRASVSRELSKLFEETRRGTLSQLALHFTQHPPKGEIVVVVEGIPARSSQASAQTDTPDED
ncbi:MAG: 16S rRNA (cytidine(1402)-2'-O)-methyltransferase [Bacteroidales bacterium]|nr:16S rRNA (cytidine(1402)-2'-O)-methyltransferase [Bacteroidales bacterium]MDD3663982.1 16S rRNA (cytidine(1402)-2'-O)-methyltransferase [Bacteroidales bacterium]